jgi:hypothetical protein
MGETGQDGCLRETGAENGYLVRSIDLALPITRIRWEETMILR